MGGGKPSADPDPRAGEMIPELGGLGLGGPQGKGSPSVSKAQNHLYDYCNC